MELAGCSTVELRALAEELGLPAYRGSQLARWIYRQGARQWEEMHNLPPAVREKFGQHHTLAWPEVVTTTRSHDGTLKLLLRLADGECIETVLLPYPDRLSICVSSQAGCAMGCAFCATGLGGFRRNLTVHEIIAQPLLAASAAGEARRLPTHVVFMGMGEPLLNLRQVLRAISLLHEEMGITMRHITVSTVGILPGMRQLAEAKLQLTLAVSLHAPTDELRHRLIPTARQTTVQAIVQAARGYVQHTGRRVTFEYVLLAGVNDTRACAHKLAELCRGWPCHVNLIPWNPVPGAGLPDVVSGGGGAFRAPAAGTVRSFRQVLEEAGISVTQRQQRGAEVAAACGQLRTASMRGSNEPVSPGRN